MTSDGQFETDRAACVRRGSFNAEQVEVTSLDSDGGWRECWRGAGVRLRRLAGSGVFRDAGTDERAPQLFYDGLTPGTFRW